MWRLKECTQVHRARGQGKEPQSKRHAIARQLCSMGGEGCHSWGAKAARGPLGPFQGQCLGKLAKSDGPWQGP